MSSKTPKFDAALDAILETLVPHERVCVDCKQKFQIEAEDIEFYRLLRVPPATHCPNCRSRRRWAYMNYTNLYKRVCDAPGHSENILSLIPPASPVTAYDHTYYGSDAWRAVDFGQKVDPNESFFKQFSELNLRAPHPMHPRDPSSVNSDYTIYGKNLKDGYYVFMGRNSEDVMYCSSIFKSRGIVDGFWTRDVDTAYQNLVTENSYRIYFSYFSNECTDSWFLFDCHNCTNCFGGVNLRNKSYIFFNEQLTREAWLAKMAQVNTGSRKVLAELTERFWNLVKQSPVRAVRSRHAEDFSGNDIYECKNVHNAFQIEKSEHVRYLQFGVGVKDSMDVNFSGGVERFYETIGVSRNSANVKFAAMLKDTVDGEYSLNCSNCNNIFGCIGLKNISYAIGNTVYEPEEYFKTLDEIKSAMLARGEYGEFFPMELSPYTYNSSFAAVTHPMTETEARSRGLYWQPDSEIDTSAMETMKAEDLPDAILDATDALCQVAIIGERSGKPFRLIPREIAFYKKHKIALPSDTPHQRIIDRFKIMNNFQNYDEVCASCGKHIGSAYKTSDGFHPYCDTCYKREVM